MKQKNKTESSTKNNRGRPAKIFTSKKIAVKKQGPGRPKKQEKINVVLPQIPEKQENKIKDMVILCVFICSFLIFCFSIYINQKQPTKSTETTGIANAATIKEGIINSGSINSGTELNTATNENRPTSQTERQKLLNAFYGSIKSGAIETAYPYLEKSLKQSNIFQKYFSKNRTQRFIKNIENNTINILPASIKETINSGVVYSLSYKIKETTYVEDREMSFIEKENQLKITKIMCITKGCSKMPFFNPGKYF